MKSAIETGVARVMCVAILSALAWSSSPPPAVAGPARSHTHATAGPVTRSSPAPRDSLGRAPDTSPLVAASGGGPELPADGLTTSDASTSAPSSGGDPLVENGLGSPMCGAGVSGLSPVSRRNCLTSGFEAAGAPTGNYGLDVHIDSGAIGFSAATLEQDYLIEPVWMGLVWVVHTLIVALEWCFTLDLLDSAAMSGVERALRGTQAAFTGPWLVLALALASLGAAYNGLVRRRVAETLGEGALMLAMMAGGLWVIADPTGTVGALGQWVDEASVGTLGAVVQGTPAQAPRTLADSLGGLFAGVVGGPWCYLEFGNVRWCSQPALLDRRLHAGALRIAAGAQPGVCGSEGAPAQVCEVLEGEQSRARAQSAILLGQARTNGELFLALPANEAGRNSINERESLLSTLCGGSEDATDCRGPTASEAEFRTQGGTGARVGGLLLIAIGALGAILLLGFVALHLLGAEIVSLLYLLLAPAAVIAPALGESGRAVFRAWATRLLGAVVSKLLFSFLLGVVLLLTRTMMELSTFGWWTRWLLVSATWWGSYRQRHRVLGFAEGEHRGGGAHPRSIVRRAREQLEAPLGMWHGAQWVRSKLSRPAQDVQGRQMRVRAGGERARAMAGRQAERMLEQEHREAGERVAGARETQEQLSFKRARLQRLRGAQAAAAAAGDTRRATRLGVRARRIEGELGDTQRRLNAARRTVGAGGRVRHRTGRRYTPADVDERSRFLDTQAALPAGGGDAGGRQSRDYATLAPLGGYGREQYERLDPQQRRQVRLEIDRELALRRELGAAAGDVAAGAEGSSSNRERQRAAGDFDRALGQRLHSSGQVPPRSMTDPRSGQDARRDAPPLGGRSRAEHAHDGRTQTAAGRESSAPESRVMRDAREVAQRRKRQLGGG
jgi:hypothetical protein